eukprot:NODE_3279_length_1008_cov_34.877998_g3016_i0.p1 GENE.NODE_3279_length_1008_cov_34.877998_g3016_i0~~NODE_3279_length_1008_cov_34.877998_g3016_i0.p1  ORF type:complete len:162 (+),score=19.86 NODE_3279_length_1008_cov_34.877998_g3016_i0:160-645(+)
MRTRIPMDLSTSTIDSDNSEDSDDSDINGEHFLTEELSLHFNSLVRVPASMGSLSLLNSLTIDQGVTIPEQWIAEQELLVQHGEVPTARRYYVGHQKRRFQARSLQGLCAARLASWSNDIEYANQMEYGIPRLYIAYIDSFKECLQRSAAKHPAKRRRGPA